MVADYGIIVARLSTNLRGVVMKKRERTHVQDVVDKEGFEYAFLHSSDFEKVKDEKFHELRKAYLAASKALYDYVFPGEHE